MSRQRPDPAIAMIFSMMVILIMMIPIGMSMRIGVKHEYNGIVEYTEKDSYLYLSTKVVMRTLGGGTVSVYLYGWHDFELGKQYKIQTVTEWKDMFMLEVPYLMEGL